MTQIFAESLGHERMEKVMPVLRAALDAADPRTAVLRHLSFEGERLVVAGESVDLRHYRRLRVVGVGKACQAMALGLLDVLGQRVADGLLITKHVEQKINFPANIRVLPGGHPVPSPESAAGGQALADFLADGEETDLVFCLISGGGSALVVSPQSGVDLEDLQVLTRLLLACGANIREINTLRKHLDRVKGGGIARLAAPARLVTLILSDVIGSPLDVIASGPTVADPTTYADALRILEKYAIQDQAPLSIRSILARGIAGEIPESLKPGDPLLSRITNSVIASNVQAAQAALERAQAAGFHALLLSTYLEGEAAQVGLVLAGILKQIVSTGQPLQRPACVIAGGETTVTLSGSGLGGRSQELALSASFLLSELPDVALLAMGTDGEDGPTDAAGAVVNGSTLARAHSIGLDPLAHLRDHDPTFFAALNDLVITGPTGTNVNDLVFLFAF